MAETTWTTVKFDATMLREVLGSRPAAAAVAEIEAEVRQPLAQYQDEDAARPHPPTPILVRGHPLTMWLDLDVVGRLIGRGRP